MASYRIAPPLSITLQVTNVFDTRFATFGALGDATRVLGPGFASPLFQAPGAPRAAFLTIDLRR